MLFLTYLVQSSIFLILLVCFWSNRAMDGTEACASLKQGGTWDRSAKTMATFSALNALPGPRHALRRFYENNAKVITTVPKDRLVVIDYTERDSQKGLAK
jgi:hypothetical protein